MIGKASLGSYIKGILEYCYYDKELTARMKRQLRPEDIRGELVYIQNLALKMHSDGRINLDYLARQYIDNHQNNKRLNKYVWHQSFSFAPGERLDDEKIIEISTEFAREFGFEQNQMVVFKHQDTEHFHFHIIANRINHNGKNTADHFNNYARTGRFCRRMEQELSLIATPDMKINQKRQSELEVKDKVHLKLKIVIDKLLPEVSSIQQLKERLAGEGYKTYLGRGISFFHSSTKVKMKGSDLGRNYSLAALEKALGQQVAMESNQNQERVRRRKQGLRV
ncbi:relaxase/mobilization nuclease domain-containing protein [Leadbetterella byssophila]|uniref:Relaxase/mobilization nuclease family protein n=1 Tax=Leadbetterella byssophila (strain DSM 17132 / JCM 16389 / KACC 11308 / NBRC 106382 / 4M15) TaxID=649349 RepID=E4RVK3_LEAB4|nr:relaxase/mobilization nuclease domain-containing protein [Leadbetterella byssophila]ADQ17067.1 Relaxase/mobilization nuclease family protein [Leadbetterella byssophila DSM 17132]